MKLPLCEIDTKLRKESRKTKHWKSSSQEMCEKEISSTSHKNTTGNRTGCYYWVLWLKVTWRPSAIATAPFVLKWFQLRSKISNRSFSCIPSFRKRALFSSSLLLAKISSFRVWFSCLVKIHEHQNAFLELSLNGVVARCEWVFHLWMFFLRCNNQNSWSLLTIDIFSIRKWIFIFHEWQIGVII
jgi:hypothetical protein